jgi:excisionase family DNA binding protein
VHDFFEVARLWCHTDPDISQRNGGRRREPMTADRFLTLGDVADVLNISASQTYALVRSGALPAIKIGGRGQWRVEREQLEDYIGRMYEETRRFVQAHPFGGDEPLPPD